MLSVVHFQRGCPPYRFGTSQQSRDKFVAQEETPIVQFFDLHYETGTFLMIVHICRLAIFDSKGYAELYAGVQSPALLLVY